MDTQFSYICKSAWFYLRNISKICPYLSKSSTEKLSHSFVSAKLDCSNGLLYGVPDDKTTTLQCVQNAVARPVTLTSKYEYFISILKSLHCLPISQWIDYKMLLTFRSWIDNVSNDLQELLQLSAQSRSL